MPTTTASMPTNLPRLSVYLPLELREALERLAAEEDRSLNKMAIVLMREAIAERARKSRGTVE